ncbi:hypothetical protein V502_08476 [Pseudogymnoascus sp. VKM F-4520 (FW-2644)]|nr:hypothetical protein V502_08476 [Pseudogymnoascus sp. VKM F-4520 (FW-2644)]
MTGNTSSPSKCTNRVRLIAAIVNDDEENAEELVKSVVDVDETNLGTTPLYWAACFGRLNWITRLLDLGANIQATTIEGETALHIAARNGKAEAVLLLLERGADIRQSDLRGWTALHAAIEEGKDYYRVVLLLVENGADILAADVSERTAGYFADLLKQKDIATLLKLKQEELCKGGVP